MLLNCSIASFLVLPIILPCFVLKFKKKNPSLDTTIAEVLSLLNIGVVKSVLLLMITLSLYCLMIPNILLSYPIRGNIILLKLKSLDNYKIFIRIIRFLN
jgi:hypothetical protein